MMDLAEYNYEKSLVLEPENDNAVMMLEKIREEMGEAEPGTVGND